MTGKIFLIPTSLGETSLKKVLPEDVFETINKIDHFIVENERTARRFLIKAGINKQIDELQFYLLNKHSRKEEISNYILVAKKGHSIGIISEAGVPGIADPGAEIVKIAHENNIDVVPLVGPSSILLALMASGLNGQNFAFNGYLPVKETKVKEIIRLEQRAKKEKQSQIFIEAPYRNMQLLEVLLSTLDADTSLCIASNITTDDEYIRTMKIKEWKKAKKPDLHKKPCIFIFL